MAVPLALLQQLSCGACRPAGDGRGNVFFTRWLPVSGATTGEWLCIRWASLALLSFQ